MTGNLFWRAVWLLAQHPFMKVLMLLGDVFRPLRPTLAPVLQRYADSLLALRAEYDAWKATQA